MKRIIRILAVVLFVTFVGVPVSVHADIAPPGHPPGTNPQPSSELTQVRMMAETVLIDVQASTPQNSLGQAKVNADFTMRNLGNEAENIYVRFPIGSNNGFGDVVEIKNLNVKVDGRLVVTSSIRGNDPVWGGDVVPWAQFFVTFPSNQDVNIQVSYLLEGTGEYPFVAFYYLLHTGAGWNGTIGSADLIVRLPYEATPQNVIFDEQTGWSETTAGGVIQGQDIRWHFENLEPDQSNDFQISLVMPSAWQQVIRERGNVSANPKDGEAWGRLGKLYKEMFFFRKGFRTDAGGQQLYALSMDAYEKCLLLLPNDAQWHAGYADLLANHAWFSAYDAQDVRPEMLHAMQEINTALQIAPDDPKVKEIADNIYYSFPADSVQQLESGYDFIWLTTTPDLSTPTLVPVEATFTPLAAPSATLPPAITETAVPVSETTPVPTSTPVTATNPLCEAGLLVPLGLVWLARQRTFLRS